MALPKLNPYDLVIDNIVDAVSNEYKSIKKDAIPALGTERISKAQYKRKWLNMNKAQRLAEIRTHGIQKIMGLQGLQ